MSGPAFCLKQGSSLVIRTEVSQDGEPVDITGWVIRSQVVQSGRVVAVLDVEIEDGPKGIFRAEHLDTSTWPTTTLTFNFRYETPTGYVHITPDAQISIQAGVPYA